MMRHAAPGRECPHKRAAAEMPATVMMSASRRTSAPALLTMPRPSSRHGATRQDASRPRKLQAVACCRMRVWGGR